MDLSSLLHWSLLAATLICGATSELIKRFLLYKNKTTELKGWPDVAQRVIPVILGLVIGLIPGVPSPEKIHYGISTVLYFGSAGVLSAYLYPIVMKTFILLSEKLPAIILEVIRKKLGLNKETKSKEKEE